MRGDVVVDDDDFGGVDILAVTRDMERQRAFHEGGDEGTAVFDARLTLAEVFGNISAHKGADDKNPDTWPEEDREVVFAVLNDTIAECGGSIIRAALVLNLSSRDVNIWTRSASWREYQSSPEELAWLRGVARRAALAYSARILSREADNVSEIRAQERIAVALINRTVPEEEPKRALLPAQPSEPKDPAWRPTRTIPDAEEDA